MEKKTIKAWAVLWKEGNIFSNILNQPMPIFDTKKEAKNFKLERDIAMNGISVLKKYKYKTVFKVIPCKIIY